MMNKENAKKNLSEIKDILDKSSIKNFLIYGSCLGLIREEDIIEYDTDTDIGIIASDWKFDVLKVFAENGFRILNIFGMFNYGCEISFARNGIKTDIMFFYFNGFNWWNALWKNGCRNGESDMIKHLYSDEMFRTFTEKRFKSGEMFLVPQDYNKYLIAVYGEKWKIPVKEWDWRTDHFCISNE